MSADNYLLIDKYTDDAGFPVYHLFASDEELNLDVEKPLFVGATWLQAYRWARNWTEENVCEYGINITDAVCEETDEVCEQ